MVAIVSGMQAGLNLGSREVLGSSGLIGNALEGRNGQGVYVNVGNGLLVVQKQDDLLVSRGHDAAVLRTYNSGGVFNDDNGDNWTSGVVSLRLAGALNAAGSTVQRVDRDGSTATYTFDAARNLYVTTEGAGAHDSIAYVAADAQFEWRDGSTGATQRFEGSGQYRLLASRDASGVACTYAYGAGGFLSSVTTASGESIFYDYAGANLSQVRTVAGGVTTTRVRYGYDAANRLAAVTVDLTPGDNSVADGKVYQTTYAYDGTSRRIATIGQSDGTSLAFTYVDLGGGNFKVASVRDGLNQTSTFAYGAGFTTVTDPLGLVTRYDYDAAGQLTKVTAPAVAGVAATKQFAYSASGDVASVTDGEGRSVTFQYDANGNQVLQRDPAGNTVTRTFDARNQLLTETVYRQPDPDGAGAALPGLPETTRHAYDAAGRNLLRFTVTGEGRVTEYRYNGFGEQVSAIVFTAGTYALGALAAEAPLSEAQLAAWAATQDPAKTQRTDFAYDARGQVQSRTTYARVAATGEGVLDGSQSLERYVYDSAGLRLQTVSPGNGNTNFTYDGLGRSLSRTNALGQVELTQYDDAGRKTLVTLASGLVTTSAFDAAGRLVSVAQSSPAAGALGETRYFYDAANRLRMTQDPTGIRTWSLYDEAGRKTADVDGNGTMNEYSYDRAGQLVRTMAWGTAVNTALLVDAAGLPILSATAATVRPAESAADGAIWRQYDGANRLVRVAEHRGTMARAAVTETRYDGASRIVEVVRYANTVPTDGSAGSVALGAVPLPAASTQDRSSRNFHDADGRLAGTLDAEGYLTTFRYTATGELAERTAYTTQTNATLRATGTLAQLTPGATPGDVRQMWLYDGKRQRVAHVDGEGFLTENVYDANGNLAQAIRYANRVTSAVTVSSFVASIRPPATASDRATTRAYDALDRLVQETSPEGVVTQYAYDTAGNLTSTVRAVGTTEVRSLLARYDVQGRLAAELSAQGAALLTGGQTQAQVDAVWAQHATTYTYDAASRRASATDALGNRTLFFYNADGALTHSVNALGEVQETRYDARGRVTEQIAYAKRIGTSGFVGGLVPNALTTALGAAANTSTDSRTTITYTRDSQVASSTDAVGTVTTTGYNAFAEESSTHVAGAAFNTLATYTVDKRGQRTGTVQDPAGVNAVTSAVYDAFGREVRSIGANGGVREQTYDRTGRVVMTRDPSNALRSTTYDAFGRVLTQTDALGNVTSYAYNASARTMSVTTAEGLVTTTTHTRHGQVQSIRDAKGQVTSYTYDRDGRLLQTATPHTTSSSAYDAAGRLTEAIDAAGNRVAYSYDAANRVLTRRVDPLGLNLLTTYQYDAKGQRVSTTDANNVITTTEFDRRGQVLKQTVDPGGLSLETLYTYDARGNTLTVRSPGGSVTQYVYDTQGRRTQERVDPAGLNLLRSWTYDAGGNVLSSTDARANVTRYAYDANDRLVFTLDPLGNVRQHTYDAEGRVAKTVAYAAPIVTTGLPAIPTAAQIQPLLSSRPAQDAVEHRVHDKDGRLAARVDGTGAVVRYTYDANGNLVARTAHAARLNLALWTPGTVPVPVADPSLDETVHTVYDGLNRAVYSVDATGAVVSMAYDGNGNVLQRTAFAGVVPVTTALTADALAAAVALIASPGRDATVRNTYDAAGRLTWTVDGMGAVSQRVYDGNGNVVRQVAYATAIGAAASASSVAASANDRSTAMAYDSANRMVFQVDTLRGVTEQAFDADGRVIMRTAYANPIASIPVLGTSGTASAIRSAVGANAAVDRTTRYGYDGAGRLALAIDAMGSAFETRYDAAGNATSVIAYAKAVNAQGLPVTAGLASLKALVIASEGLDRVNRTAYDAAGQRVYTVDAARAVTASEYDGVGRLVRRTQYAKPLASSGAETASAISLAIQPDPANDRAETHGYNAAGQLVSSTDALNATESFTYDGLGRKLTLTNKKGSTWTYAYDAAGRLLTETSPKVDLTFAEADASGNITLSPAANEGVVTRLAYDALGNLTQRTEAAGRPEARTTRYEYDALGRQVRVVFPAVHVYNAAGDAVTSNGAIGVATRVETLKPLETRTIYDALGNAVASRDVADAVGHKAYDLLGRVAYEVDAAGYVTGYVRNSFGDVTTLTRYGAATALANAIVTEASQAVTRTQVEAAIGAVGVDHSKDRVLATTYDRAGRATEVTQASAFAYDPGGPAGSQARVSAARTQNVYDAFGQRVQVKVLRNEAANTWATTTSYFDLAGRETETVDALGYLTKREFDVAGNLTLQKEYATALASPWTTASFGVPATSVDDRAIRYTYDRLNRKVAETRLQVEHSTTADAVSARGDLATTYAYDAVGNQVRATDAAGNSTYTAFDALGRITAVTAPARNSTVDGSTLSPLTVFRRDAHGNVVAKVEYARGAAGTGPSPVAADAADRTTLAVYDSHGRSTQTTHANDAKEFFSYDAHGHVAKKWQGVTGSDGTVRTAFELNFYDKLGQLVETRTPASTSVFQAGGIATMTQVQAGVISTGLEYNGFGEITRKGTQGGRQEYFDYDNAGRLWRTNTGDGVDRIRLYDLQGNATAEIRSSGVGRDNVAVTTFASAQAAHENPYTRRTDTHYDLLGRVTKKEDAARQEVQGGASVQRQFTTATATTTLVAVRTEEFPATYRNEVRLSWNSLARLGNGDVKVYLEYRTPNVLDEGTIYPGALVSYSSGILSGGDAETGAFLNLGISESTIGEVTRIVVFKKDAAGGWQTVIDQQPGYGSYDIAIAAPIDGRSGVKLEMRTAGSAGDTGWWTPGLVNFGAAIRADLNGLSPGNYEYRAKIIPVSEPERVIATGTLSVTQPPLNNITVPISFGPAGTPSVLAWATPGTGVAQVLRYRVNGSTGAWAELPVQYYGSTLNGVDASALTATTYQYELLWTIKGQGVPSSHATGTFTIVPPQPAYWVPPSNLPNITGLAGVLVSGQPAFQWNAVDAATAQYRVPGGTWTNLTIDSSLALKDEAGIIYGGTDRASMAGIPLGTYEVRVFKGSPATAQATGTITLHASSGYYTTVYVQVYMERARTYTVGGVTYYEKDEDGNIIYEWAWVSQPQQVWVNGTMQTPLMTVTTPPYSAGYWVPATRAQFQATVSTVTGSTAISSISDAVVNQAAALNGDTRWLRPVVLQNTDRWGNVVSITDPRSSAWKTTYRYNANNQMVQQTLPDAGAGGAITSVFYDALGRQVAVRDARGYVNGQVFDASGNLVREVHADTGVVTHAFNAFGEKVRTIDAEGKVVSSTYDKVGNLLQVHRGVADVYKAQRVLDANGVPVTISGEALKVDTRSIVESWTYDQLGRKLSHTNGNGEVLSYAYDLAGNLVGTTQPLGQAVRAAFDAQGRKVTEVDANGKASTWAYDYFGQLKAHVDLGGASYLYTYDHARQLLEQSNSRGQRLQYAYDAAGQVTMAYDAAVNKTTTYLYDLSGRRIRERVVQNGVTYQDNHLAYDARGYLRDVADARSHVSMDYDSVGNRTQVFTTVNYIGTGGETTKSSTRFFQYDSMNRQVVVDAADAVGNLNSAQGHRISYDKNGNRKTDTYWGNVVKTSFALAGVTSDSESPSGATVTTVYSAVEGWTTEEYRYDALDRLESVFKDGMKIDLRRYDGAGRVVQSGAPVDLPVGYADAANLGLAPDEMNGKERRVNLYDANGRLLRQRVFNADGTEKFEMSWERDAPIAAKLTLPTFAPVFWYADGYDNAGNVLGYVVRGAGWTTNKYTTSLKLFEGYQAGETRGESTRLQSGSSTQEHDNNGFLVRVTDTTQPKNNRWFVNDANGRALFVNQGGNIQRQMIVNGEMLGIYGVGVDPNKPVNGIENNPSFANLVDFDFGYSKITANYPNAAPGAYTIRTGDTLQTIAQSAFGDSALWYRIAEANGLSSNNDLRVGQTLNIPNLAGTVHNNSTTFKPYDPSRIEGDKSPNLPAPKAKKKGGFFRQLIVAIVAFVMIAIAGPYAGPIGSALIASFVSQVTAVAMGVREDLSARQMGVAALTAGVGEYVSSFAADAGGWIAEKGLGQVMVKGAVASALGQGVAVAVGLQKRFDWRAVAASGPAAGVAAAVAGALSPGVEGTEGYPRVDDDGNPMPGAPDSDGGRYYRGPFGSQVPNHHTQLASAVASRMAGSLTASIARGGRVRASEIAADVFGNALGQSIAASSNGAPTTPAQSGADDPLGHFIAKNNNWAHVDVQAVAQQQQRDALYGWNTGNDGLGFKPIDGISIPRMRYQGMVSDDLRTFSDSADPDGISPLGGEADGPARVAFLGGLLSPANPAHPLNPLNPATGGTRGYTPIRPDGAGGPPPYDIVRERPSGAPGFAQANPSLGLGTPPQLMPDKPWFDKAIEGMPIGAKAAAALVQTITTKVGEALSTTSPSDSNGAGVRAYPDGSLRTPDGKFASVAGMPAPGTVNASNYAEFLKKNGVDVVGTELEVTGPLGVRKYDIGTRNPDGTIFGIEIKSGGATKSWYQEITDMYVNRFGAAGRGRIEGQRVTGSMTIYLPPGGR